ncbi:MAG: M12 family metallo-peptidase, partial [Rhodanobacteraceae bacterium]
AGPASDTLPAGYVPKDVSRDDAVPNGRAMPDGLTLAMTPRPEGALRGAVLAIDTDNEFMSERFGNDTTDAAAWIADLFTTMNVMYERDLDVRLQQGTTFLRTTADPYAQNNTPADGADLSEFASYWASHYANVPRSFAMLLSGKAPDGNQASGIAFVNSYCQNQAQGGSYSVNQIFTNPGIGVGFTVLITGHELGHNFGAYHTHCTNLNGNAPTGTNTIDKCWNEAGCYSGSTSCPASGPGAPAGTVMSYCNQLSCGPNGQNVLIFHPTQINVLNALIAQNTPGCLSAVTELIFRNGFD